MGSLQRSSVSFRRQGSSGRIWDVQMTHVLAGEPDGAKKQAKDEIDDIVAGSGNMGAATRRRSPEHAVAPMKSKSSSSSCGCNSVFRFCMQTPSTAS